MVATDPAALVRRFWLEVWGEGRLELTTELLTSPYTRHSPRGTVVRDYEELQRDVAQYRRVLSNLRVEFHEQDVVDDRVWSRISTYGYDIDTGETHDVRWLMLHRADGTKLTESWELYEPDGGWAQ